MDPVITAALIGGGAAIISGGWTALVAVTTTRNARRTNQATIDAAAENTARALDAAREERIWEKRAEAYLDAMRFVRHRQEARENATRTIRYDDATEERIRESLANFRLPESRDVELRLLAYASQQVIDAVEASGQAHQQIERAYQDWTEATGRAKSGGLSASDAAQAIEARTAVRQALKEADSKDEALLVAIREDLHSRPSQSKALPPGGSEGEGSLPAP
jgi:hypothetical protein